MNGCSRHSQEFKAKKIHKIIVLAHKFTERNIVIYPMSLRYSRAHCSLLIQMQREKKWKKNRKET